MGHSPFGNRDEQHQPGEDATRDQARPQPPAQPAETRLPRKLMPPRHHTRDCLQNWPYPRFAGLVAVCWRHGTGKREQGQQTGRRRRITQFARFRAETQLAFWYVIADHAAVQTGSPHGLRRVDDRGQRTDQGVWRTGCRGRPLVHSPSWSRHGFPGPQRGGQVHDDENDPRVGAPDPRQRPDRGTPVPVPTEPGGQHRRPSRPPRCARFPHGR